MTADQRDESEVSKRALPPLEDLLAEAQGLEDYDFSNEYLRRLHLIALERIERQLRRIADHYTEAAQRTAETQREASVAIEALGEALRPLLQQRMSADKPMISAEPTGGRVPVRKDGSGTRVSEEPKA